MTLLQTLIETTRFEQARPLWRDGLAYAVFEPFFACVLVNITQHKELVWHETFLARSKEAAQKSLQTGVFAEDLDLYWRKTHLDLKEKLIQSTGADDGILTQALPLAVHTAWSKLSQMASAQGQSIDEFAQSQLPQTLAKLPTWADTIIDETALAQLNVDSLLIDSLDEIQSTEIAQTSIPTKVTHALADGHTDNLYNQSQSSTELDDEDDYNEDEDEDEEEIPSRSRLPIVLGLLGVVAVAGAAYWYLSKDTPVEPISPKTEIALVAQNRPASTLSISVGSQGELYACHATLGNRIQSDELMKVLGTNFGGTTCVMDLSEQVSQTMAGLDKLTSALALLKTVPFATLEMQDNQVLINAPDPSAVSRLVADIGALMAGMTVKPMPALNATEAINQSLVRASTALEKLPDGANPNELAQALSLQKIDTQSGTIPEINKAVLALSAGKIATTPNAHLIIVVHSDDTGDRATARMQTQILAEAIKANLVAQGASDGQLVAQGVGFDFPVSENQTELGRFKNRRVEFLVYDDMIMQALAQPLQQQVAMPTAPTTYTVVDGRIVDASTLPTAEIIETAPQEIIPTPQNEITPSMEVIVPTIVEPTIVPQDEIASAPGYIISANPEMSAQPAPSSPIPDDLVKPLGVDTDNIPSNQIVETE